MNQVEVTLPFDIDHVCYRQGLEMRPQELGHGVETDENKCPACCYIRGVLDTRSGR